jgi:hypothetical protein
MLYELSVRFREMHNAWVAELERCGHALFQSSALLPERYDPYPCHVGQRGAPAKRKSFLQNVVAGVDATAEPFVQGVMQMAGGLQVSYNAQHALPIAVRMPDGLITAVDNTRVVAAQHAGIAVKVSVHAFDESLPPDVVARFTTRKGGVPSTWGEALINRIGRQNSSYRGISAWFILDRMGRKLMSNILSATELPAEFSYPPEFLRVLELELTSLDPWWIIEGDVLRATASGIKDRYPARRLIPFAKREDNDEVACFDLDNVRVSVIHDFADPGWEERASFPDFASWLHAAVDEMLRFE